MRKNKTNRRRWTSRRTFLTVCPAMVAAAALTASKALKTNTRPSNERSRRLAMIIDVTRCVGCHACSVACKAENGVRLGGFRTWVSHKEIGQYPTVTREFLVRMCNHCQKPACLKVCPVGATYKRADGIVSVDKERCIGCRYCMVACPYGVRYFNPRPAPRGERRVEARTPGTVDKCNLCARRVDNGLVPACVNTCPAGARIFGDLNDSGSAVYREFSAGRAEPLLAEFGTEPSVFYRGGHPWLFERDAQPDEGQRAESRGENR